MNRLLCSMAAIPLLLALGSAAAADAGADAGKSPNPLDQSLVRFMQWAPGEYDNNEQVWQEDLDNVAKPHRHDHLIVVDAHASAIGEHTLFVQQNEVGQPGEAVALRLFRVTADSARHAIRLEAYAFVNATKYVGAYARPDSLAALAAADVVHKESCSLYLTDRGDRFEGSVRADSCGIGSGKNGREISIGSMRLSTEGLWLQTSAAKPASSPPDSAPSRNRRVRYFSGWTIVKKAGPAAALDDQSMWSMVRFVIHNEGQILPIKDDKTGQDTGYSLQLAQLTYQNTRDPILKIGLIENSSGRTVAYSWASTDAKQLGMNLRWFQAGVTLRGGDAGKFGFIQPK
ncbi:CpcT/CpeT family chromophore lyase [Rhodanobacter sp. AS-Z3]|uniref:CpcT/CpeT family chromophore lyase n=1 Tax=Rhodanobacter sp. AS-Z3 TaxID=3031330 RepID=UPI0024796B1B|nr:CpcT/CpeT family chromophore lyase [Rhodanobacter sp. AS-Z3]WEN14095.1 CpcT/CpeT family chromophore lyase [Rhodanobacter sp. AS-Z3]